MSGSITIPLTLVNGVAVPATPSQIQPQLIATVAEMVPDYTANLPGSLIEDISSTQVAGLVLMDQARASAVNALSAIGSNQFVLSLLGQQIGIPQGTPTAGQAQVVFSGTVGLAVPNGFQVGDGTNIYSVQGGTVIGSSGSSPTVTVVATNNNVFPIPAGAVSVIISAVPTGYSLSVTNPQAGIAATGNETTQSYRGRLVEAQQFTATGTMASVRTALQSVVGTSSRLISILQVSGGIEIICGGGDVYVVANAILNSVLDISALQGSSISSSRNIVTSIFQNPNTYSITHVNPPSQTVTGTCTWGTTLTNFSAASAVNQAAAPAIVNYINSVYVGQPINVLEMQQAFITAVAPILPASAISALTFAISINGTSTPPSSGTNLIEGDIESYFSAAANAITVSQG